MLKRIQLTLGQEKKTAASGKIGAGGHKCRNLV